MQMIIRRPDRGYIDSWLWVPRYFVDVESTKHALTHEIKMYGGQSKFIYLWKEAEHHLLLPRAFWHPSNLPFPVVDCRPRHYQHIDFKSRIKLDYLPQELNGSIQLLPTGLDVQHRSMLALEGSPSGVLQLACGKGKTIIGLDKIARGQAPAIVMLDNTNLLYQWLNEANKLLDVPGGVGVVGDNKKEWKKGLVLATYHSIANWADTMPEEVRRWFAQVFWDEGHHASASWFSRTVDLFYGNRYLLTATPERDDGMHVIAQCHIGGTLYKDLSPMMRPSFAFVWSGLKLDLRDPTVASQVLDINQEVHTSKVYSYFGKWQQRLEFILRICNEAYVIGRKILVLSNSVGEIVNLYTMWTYGMLGIATTGKLYTDIPIPAPTDFGETLNPAELTKKKYIQLQKIEEKLNKQLKKLGGQNPNDAAVIEGELTLIKQAFKQHEIHKKIQNELSKRQKKYVGEILKAKSEAGFLTYDVPPKTRRKFIEEKQIVFAITKYGKEGLDSQALDTIVLSSLFSSANGLQQLMGRPTRPFPGKKNPLIISVVDDVGQCIGMSKKLQGHLRSWPKEEGGPYEPILVNHPPSWTSRKSTALLTDLLLQ